MFYLKCFLPRFLKYLVEKTKNNRKRRHTFLSKDEPDLK